MESTRSENPLLAQDYYRESIINWNNDDKKGCVQSLTKAIELLPKESNVGGYGTSSWGGNHVISYYYNRALCNLRSEDPVLSDALRDFDKAIELNPDVGKYYMGRKYLHEKLGNDEQALSDLEMTRSLCKSSWEDPRPSCEQALD